MLSWVAECSALNIPSSPNYLLRDTFSSAVEVHEWQLAGLPRDAASVDSAILAQRARRWPLMIDPQVIMTLCHERV